MKIKYFFIFIFITICFSFLFLCFHDILLTKNPYNLYANFNAFNLFLENYSIWNFTRISFILCFFFITFCISNFIFSFLKTNKNFHLNTTKLSLENFSLFIGKTADNKEIIIPEKGLYQNILITGTIGSGKTSSALYPFTKQLLQFFSNDNSKKFSFLILDVKGNYYKKVLEFSRQYNRINDVFVIELGGKFTYNPLDKPNLKASVIANRLKTILLLFSPNNTESYWLDKAEQVLENCIKYCRLYNDGYVTFPEIHYLVMDPNYFQSKVEILRKRFLSHNFSTSEIYELHSCLTFFEKEFFSLDERTLSILQSEISRITNIFVSDYQILKTFSPAKNELSFYGFEDILENGKIVVLNMNIGEYKNLAKIIATYLKLDFQSCVLERLNKKERIKRPCIFICDEYQEYITASDSDFFSQSREAKCINIVATQSYTSLLNSLNNKYSMEVIIQNLVNKLWFRTDDIFTIEQIQKQIGKEEKEKTSTTLSENAKETYYNPIFKNFTSQNSNISESINSYWQLDYIYDTNFFTQKLPTFTCLCFLSDGEKIIPPICLNLLPYFKN